MPTERAPVDRAPSRAVSLALSSALVVLWAFIRLVIFDETVFPLTYVIPMLVCTWTRDRVALWGMAAAFAILHTMKFVWLLPDGAVADATWWAGYTATLLNIAIGGAVVHAIIHLLERLEATLQHVRAQAEELRAQGEELAQQNEELAEQAEELSRQTEELAQQGEELADQNEELQSQAEEISAVNEALERREGLLQALLDTARLASTERTALQHIARAALDLLDGASAAAVYETTADGLRIQALATRGSATEFDNLPAPEDGFVRLVLHENRTASLNDVSLRPDLPLASFADRAAYRAALCAPIHLGPDAFGAFAVYAADTHEWTDEEFRIAEWLADQCGRVLQALRVQSELRAADQRKSEFLATLSHELRNPLAPIGFALKAIESGNGDGAQAIRILRRQFQQLVRLVDDLLDATRLSSNKIQIRKVRTDLVSVVQQAVEASRPDMLSADLDVSLDLPSDPIWLDADPDRLQQVVTNLLNNATRYTPHAGRVAVSLSASGDDEAVLSVSDSGIGLASDDLDRVFDMFTQVGGPGSGGLGIGLSLVRGIVELHGGRVQALSDGPGRGAEFRITLPLASAAPTAAAGPTTAVLAASRPCRVLIVEDNTDSGEMMRALLEAYGHSVCLAHDAASALALSVEFAPEVALVDIGLPDANGYELARQLRQDDRTRGIRLIALTGWGQEDDRARARAAGFDAHLTKPADPDRVLAAITAAQPDAGHGLAHP